MPDEALLIRFRRKDSKEGVSRATMKAIAEALDLTETAAVHRGLVELAHRYVPQYPRDNGPITDAQHRAIAEAVRTKHGEPVITEMLFGAPLQPARKLKSGGQKHAHVLAAGKQGEPAMSDVGFVATSQPARKVKSGGNKRVPASRAR